MDTERLSISSNSKANLYDQHQPNELNAVQRFSALEKSLATAKRHLGDELHGQFDITLAGTRPEYIVS